MTRAGGTAPGAAGWAGRLVLPVAAWVGATTLVYEVLWTRVLAYFVDTSLQSFAIMLTAFLSGLSAGSVLGSRLVDSKRDPLLLLAAIEVCVGVAGVLSIPVVAHTSHFVVALDEQLAPSFGAAAFTRFFAFSIALFVPTALMGGAFPVMAKMASSRGAPLGTAIGRVYAVNTAGGVLGSLSAGFVLLPWLGVQKSIALVSLANVVVGVTILAGSRLGRRAKIGFAVGGATIFGAALAAVPPGAIAAVYSESYPPPRNELLYLDENVNGTTAVFREVGSDRRYLVIDGRGEVSTDYFSMRAFRLLALLPAFYSSKAGSALIVTFGSGIVAGSVAGLPDVTDADCVEICEGALGAARYFAAENHGVQDNPKVHFLVNDGRNYLLTTGKQYEIISADATHPTSGDSWVLYTKEFYELCADRLTDSGVMSQWIPMHGIRESDFKTLLKTFHSAFPFVALYYSGGFKGAGHVVLLGSKKPLRIDVRRAEALFANQTIQDDLGSVNVLDLPDLFNCFMFDQEAIDAFAGDAPLNTDDKPVVAFSRGEAPGAPQSWLASIAKVRQSVFPQLYGMDDGAAPGIATGLRSAFEATGHAIEGQVLEAREYASRMALDLDHPDPATREGLRRSRAMLQQVVVSYAAALQTNPRDAHTTYLLRHAIAEMKSLDALLGEGRASPGGN